MKIKYYLLIWLLGVTCTTAFSQQDYPYSGESPSDQTYSSFFENSLSEAEFSNSPPVIRRAYDPNEDPYTPTPGGKTPIVNGELIFLFLAVVYVVYILNRKRKAKLS